MKQLNKMLSGKFLLQMLPLLLVDILYLGVQFALEWQVSFSMIVYLLGNSLENAPIDSFRYYIGRQLMLLSITIIGYILICFIVTICHDKLLNFSRFFKIKYVTICSYVVLLILIIPGLKKLDFFDYVSNLCVKSTYIEDNYTDVSVDDLVVPDHMRNLIVLNLESMESSYADIACGGILSENLIPGLSEIKLSNISFSTVDTQAYTQMYADYTFASLVATSSGLPFKGSSDSNVVALGGDKYNVGILPGVPTFGSLLYDIGYHNYAVMGCDATFSGKRDFLLKHGNYDIYDYVRAKDEKFVSENYGVRWGLEDQKVFAYAKHVLNNIQTDEPFNMMIETSDIHFPNGYVCELCDRLHESSTADVINCTDRQVVAFLNWCKDQPWYDNTTIVLLGDHLYMGTDCFEYYGLSGLANRTIYNCFINVNCDVDTTRLQNRKYTSMDMCPTILNSIGIQINGDRIGLGTNLFSGELTLSERDGYDVLHKELGRCSDFYNSIY